MGSATGVLKVAAKRIGISERRYRAELAAGKKWCGACRQWQLRQDFNADRSRGDGLTAICAEARSAPQRGSYVPKPRPLPGRVFTEFRDGDKRQARRRVNHLRAVGLLPDPNTLPCVDCGGINDQHGFPARRRRHEYDHYLGYAAEHHEHVQAVCSSCHRKRTEMRSKCPTERK